VTILLLLIFPSALAAAFATGYLAGLNSPRPPSADDLQRRAEEAWRQHWAANATKWRSQPDDPGYTHLDF
jgi:hypothetical protein